MSHVLKGEKWVTGRSGVRLWLWVMISSQGCRWLKIELIRLWNSILPEHGHPTAKLTKLICLTAWKGGRWYRIVYIPWLVASYDPHKGKRFLNSDPQTTGAKTYQRTTTIYAVFLYYFKAELFEFLYELLKSHTWFETRRLFSRICNKI